MGKDEETEEQVRGFAPNWNSGVMEWWNDGFEGILFQESHEIRVILPDMGENPGGHI